ncbi:MAG: YgfZ/GcvT domain-containing protein [Chthoniobacterales bacterium]
MNNIGASPAALRDSARGPFAFELSTRSKLRLRGADRLRFLNGQMTNEVAKATEGRAVHALILNAKGKIDAEIFVHALGDFLILDAAHELREKLPARLERYVIADDVEVEDATEEFALFHVVGDSVPAIAKAVRCDRFGTAGHDLWAGAADHDSIAQKLATDCELLTDQSAEGFRIARGIPRWGRELTGEIIPVEANLENAAIDYAKGCYIGQEVISRMKMSGQTNKRLCGLVSVGGAALRDGMHLFETNDSTREIGWITSATYDATLAREIALGYVRRGHNEPGTQLFADAATRIAVQVVTLPFV